jgi:hypothetical protein
VYELVFEGSTLWFCLWIGNGLKHCTFQRRYYILALPGPAEFSRPTEGDSDVMDSKRVGEVAVLYQTEIPAQLRNTLNHRTMRYL